MDNKDQEQPNTFKDENYPFGPEGSKPLNEVGGFDFGGKSLNEVFNSFDWKQATQEELKAEIKNERNTRIMGVASLLCLFLNPFLFLPDKFTFGGVLGAVVSILGIILGITWYVRKGYIFFYRKNKSKKSKQ